MSELGSLGRDAVSLLLSLLEADEPVIAATAIELLPRSTPALIKQGLLVPAGYDDVIDVEIDGQEELVSVFAHGEDDTLGYLDRHAGFVVVPPGRLLRRRVEMSATLRLIAMHLETVNTEPVEIVEGICWDLGNVQFAGRPERHSVWFARRLWNPHTRDAVRSALLRRPHSRSRILLTSGPSTAWGSDAPPGIVIASVMDALQHPDCLAVDPEIVVAHLSGRQPPQALADVELSSDGTRLTLGREHVFIFRGPGQMKAIAKLVAAHRRGEAARAIDVTDLGSLQRVFGKKHWSRLSAFLKSGPEGWRFEVRGEISRFVSRAQQ